MSTCEDGLWKQLDRRNLKIYTGSKGMESYHEAMEQFYLMGRLDDMIRTGKIKLDEYLSLKELVEAGPYDKTIAKVIIEQKDK